LAGCGHKTVAHWVRAREVTGGGLPVAVRPRPRVDAFAVKIEEWVDRSRGKIRADALPSAAGRDGLHGVYGEFVLKTGIGRRVALSEPASTG
jgi:hypothetical protein